MIRRKGETPVSSGINLMPRRTRGKSRKPSPLRAIKVDQRRKFRKLFTLEPSTTVSNYKEEHQSKKSKFEGKRKQQRGDPLDPTCLPINTSQQLRI